LKDLRSQAVDIHIAGNLPQGELLAIRQFVSEYFPQKRQAAESWVYGAQNGVGFAGAM
jgi:hypothetical protein